MDNVEEIIKNPIAGDEVGRFIYAEDEYYFYKDHIISIVKGNFSGMKNILDVANELAYGGDKLIAVLALEMKDRGELKNNQVVTTVMSNIGFENYLLNKGIHLIRVNVGDRYVLEKMKELNVNIGGE